MNQKQIVKLRVLAWRRQRRKCFYCGCETWERTIETKDEARLRLGIPSSRPGAKRALRNSMATAEHLIRKADGGPNHAGNIVAACFACNNRRGELSPEQFKATIEQENSP